MDSASDSRLRVAFVCHGIGLSGAERALLELVRDLIADHGVEALVVLPEPGPLGPRLEAVGARLAYFERPPPWWCLPGAHTLTDPARRARARQGVELVEGILPRLADFAPRVVLTMTLAHPWGAVAAARRGVPHVWVIAEHAGPGLPLDFVYPPAATRAAMLEASAAVLVLSRKLAQAHFPDAPPGRVEVVYQHFPDPSERQGPCPEDLYPRPGARRLAIFGQLCPLKGQEDALRALALLVGQGRDLVLLMAGPVGPSEQLRLAALAVELGVLDRIRIPGVLPNPFPAMGAADAVLVCSYSEGFGRVPLEAMMLGRPVVHSDAGDFVETFPAHPVAWGYRSGDVPGLAAAIAAVLDAPAEAAVRAAAARDFALRAFPKAGYSGKVHAALVRAAEAGAPATIPPMLAEAAGEAARRAPPVQDGASRSRPPP